MPCRRPSDRRRRRAGTARLGYGALRHVGQRRVELPLVLFLTAGSVLGVHVGVRLVRRFRGPRIRRLFAGVMLLGIAVIVWDLGRRLLAEQAPGAAGAGGDVL